MDGRSGLIPLVEPFQVCIEIEEDGYVPFAWICKGDIVLIRAGSCQHPRISMHPKVCTQRDGVNGCSYMR